MAVTSLESLKEFAQGAEVELPGFVEGEPFIARLRRPSLFQMAQDGTIPNPLLGAAAELFRGGVLDAAGDKENVKSTAEVLRIFARASLVEPTYEALEEMNLPLTDMQLMQIYNYGITGVDSLGRFRKEQKAQRRAKRGGGVPGAAE